jgi:hypothetical protein
MVAVGIGLMAATAVGKEPEGGSPEYRAVAAHVMQFKTSPRFRMWYQSFPDWHPWRPDEKIRFASSYAVSEDGIDLPVSWKAGAKLVGLDHSRVRFRFSLKNAKLFSFWVD